MSRAVKDLRELINVSRLSFRDEENSVDHSYSSRLHLPDLEGGLQRTGVAEEEAGRSFTKGHSFPRGTSRSAPVHQASRGHEAAHKVRSSSVHPQAVTAPQVAPSHYPPLDFQRPRGGGAVGSDTAGGTAEEVVARIDKEYLKELLAQSSSSLTALSLWWADPVKACKFMHFWLKEIDEMKRLELLQMEYSIVREEVQALFAVPLATGDVKVTNTHGLLHAVLHEYPSAFCGANGRKVVIDVICLLASEKRDEFKKLLTDVHLSSKSKPAIESFLSLRSFGLVSMMHSIVCFFCKTAHLDLPRANVAAVGKSGSLRCSLVHCAVSSGFTDVLQYLWQKDRHSFAMVDDHGRSLVFLAVQQRQLDALKLLLEKSKLSRDVDANLSSSSGNTPLHAAVTAGDVECVRILVKAGVNVNAWNTHSDGATPLHLAVMYGHKSIVEELLAAGALVDVRMGVPATTTPVDLAKDFEQHDILGILQSSANMPC